ncbi:hypothetical protein HMPREF9186_01023 [Streptococcus sp. F0442]|uniref:hypothetical protein n=1 Tax=Streptococcus sp. F0442 TaxID=999425 RepID=UPI000299403F|nr:hypothetical protein [Streptococcus sp. F0442]EKS20447.1 hypothetical protein HMPREF9186_01023 [Streptococcus sp. F0442]
MLKKILSLKLVCLAIIVVGLVFYFKPSDTNKKPIEKRPSSTEVIHEGNLKDVQLFGEKNQFVLSKDLTLVDGKYLVGFDYVNGDEDIKKKYIGFRYYDIDNQFKETTVNVLDEIRKTAPKAFINDYQININSGVSVVDMGYYMSRRAMERDIGDEKNIYYKLDEQKYYSKYAIPEGSAVKEKIIDYTNLMELIDKNTGFDLQAGFKFQKQAKNVNTDINLFAIYPEFKEKMLSGKYWIEPRLQLLSSKEWFDTLLHWFAPKGQDVLPGVKIEAQYSIDGQEHEIRSYDEFKQYYNGKGGELID